MRIVKRAARRAAADEERPVGDVLRRRGIHA
jgi:hypothetical protein